MSAAFETSSSADGSRRPRKKRPWRSSQDVWLPAATLLTVFVAWEIVCRSFKVPAYLLPSPSAIWTETGAMGAKVVEHTQATLVTVLLGFAVSVPISLALAVGLTASRALANAIYPLLVMIQSVPKVALAPILVVMLGTNELPRVVITFLLAFFPLVLSTAAGLLAVPPELIELGRACKASRWQELRRIKLPFAVPFIFSGLKAAITLAVVGAVVAEFVSADRGLGYLILTSTAFFKVPTAWGALIILSIMGVVLFQAIVIIERVFFPWSSSDQAAG